MDLGPRLGHKLPTEYVLDCAAVLRSVGWWLLFGFLLVVFVAYALDI
jgi:hypothetical protein